MGQGGMRWERAGHGNGRACDIGDMSKGMSVGKGDVWEGL